MDFSEQDVDVFGEDFEADEEEEAGAERADAAEEDGGGSGDSSGSSSSSSSSSSSASDSSSRSSSDGEEEDGNTAAVRVRTAGVEGEYAEDQEEEEDRDLFGPENEAYMKTLARSPYPVPSMPYEPLFMFLICAYMF